jgi:hypothetical protein
VIRSRMTSKRIPAPSDSPPVSHRFLPSKFKVYVWRINAESRAAAMQDNKIDHTATLTSSICFLSLEIQKRSYANEKLKGCAENFNAFRLRSSVKKLPETRINTDAPAKSTSLNLPDHRAEPR